MIEVLNDSKSVYELVFLLREENNSTARQILEKNGAEIISEKPFQKVRLAYLVKKQQYAFWSGFVLRVLPERVSAINHDFKMNESFLRHALGRVIIKQGETHKEGLDVKQTVEKRRPLFSKEPVRQSETVLTNEALEKKIEEILR